MMTLFWFVFWAGLTILAFAAGVSLRVWLREELKVVPHSLDDEGVRAILETGTLVTDEDEPLDLGEIDEEERRFWSENWEEPEEW